MFYAVQNVFILFILDLENYFFLSKTFKSNFTFFSHSSQNVSEFFKPAAVCWHEGAPRHRLSLGRHEGAPCHRLSLGALPRILWDIFRKALRFIQNEPAVRLLEQTERTTASTFLLPSVALAPSLLSLLPCRRGAAATRCSL